jgi:hypothetical protein
MNHEPIKWWKVHYSRQATTNYTCALVQQSTINKAVTISRYSAERDIGQWKWQTTREGRFTNSTQYSAIKSDFSVHWIT